MHPCVAQFISSLGLVNEQTISNKLPVLDDEWEIVYAIFLWQV